MGEVITYITEKVSSYDIFNNLFPGVIYCSLLTKVTRFCLTFDNIIEQFFIWYFTGMIISRIGSVLVEFLLKKLKYKNKPLIIFANYEDYISASEAKPRIATLSEKNNIYRTIIALIFSLELVYIYDIFIFCPIKEKCVYVKALTVAIVGILLIILFILSYKKQTDYVRKQVNKYTHEQNLS